MALTAYNGDKPYIFISYAHKDSDKVLPIVESLTASGFRVWYDAGIVAGTEWPEFIATKLLESACVIAFISKAALASQNCTREINYAISENKAMLSVYLEDVVLSPGMKMQLGTVQGMYYNRSPFETFVDNLKSTPMLNLCGGESAVIPAPAYSSDFEIENGVLKKYTGSDANVIIPDSVTEIGEEAFFGCISLTSIALPDSVTSIGDSAFSGCNSLTSITIPDSVTSIGDGAFKSCSTLTNITVNPNNKVYRSEGNGIIEKSTNTLVVGCMSTVIPDSVTSIGDSAFSGCNSLTNITIPDSVTSIGNGAFRGCDSLHIVTIPDSVTSIGSWSFSSCGNLTSITIPDGMTSIGSWSFSSCSNLTSITIPDGMTSIGEFAFSYCTSLTSITIPDSVRSIGAWAFGGCASLTIYCEAATQPYGWNTLWNCYNILNFSRYPVIWGCKGSSTTEEFASEGLIFELNEDGSGYIVTGIGTCKDADVVIPKTYKGKPVTSIGDKAFSWCCQNLISLSIPDSVTSIGNQAFYHCTSLRSITIPNSVTCIGWEAFKGCSSLTSIVIPNSVTSIGGYAFDGCFKITIYCEAERKPSELSSGGAFFGRRVVWGYKGE